MSKKKTVSDSGKQKKEEGSVPYTKSQLASGKELLKIANVGQDAGVVDANNGDAFIAAAKTRQWGREKKVRTLA